MKDSDITALVDVVRKTHASGKHVVFLVQDMDIVEIAHDLASRYSHSEMVSEVEFLLDDKWVCFRPLVDKVPTQFLQHPSVSVVVLTP
jgi:hypothetical protein